MQELMQKIIHCTSQYSLIFEYICNRANIQMNRVSFQLYYSIYDMILETTPSNTFVINNAT